MYIFIYLFYLFIHLIYLFIKYAEIEENFISQSAHNIEIDFFCFRIMYFLSREALSISWLQQHVTSLSSPNNLLKNEQASLSVSDTPQYPAYHWQQNEPTWDQQKQY